MKVFGKTQSQGSSILKKFQKLKYKVLEFQKIGRRGCFIL
jgi:hypothetical protein